MKRISLLFLFFLVLITLQCCKEKLQVADWIKPGTQFIYEVNHQGTIYDFIVNILKLAPDLNYSWQMTDPVNIEGVVLITASAMDSAYIHKNYYNAGEFSTSDQTSGWLSRKSFQELKDNGSTVIQNGYFGSQFELKLQETTTLPVMLNGEEIPLPVIYAESENGFKYWVLNDSQYPVILHMILDFEINIKSITF